MTDIEQEIDQLVEKLTAKYRDARRSRHRTPHNPWGHVAPLTPNEIRGITTALTELMLDRDHYRGRKEVAEGHATYWRDQCREHEKTETGKEAPAHPLPWELDHLTIEAVRILVDAGITDAAAYDRLCAAVDKGHPR